MILETDKLSREEKACVASNLEKLRIGIQQKMGPPGLLSEEASLKNLFLKFDKDNSGRITINELNSMCLHCAVPLRRKYTMQIMKYIDKDNTGFIN